MKKLRKQELKSYLIKQLEIYKRCQEKLSGWKLEARDFDVFTGGWVAGLSLVEKRITVEDIKDIIATVIKESEIAKSYGVSGTLKEIAKKVNL